MNLLDRLKLSFRCPADWESMEGDERKRFCSHCRKHVHNLSAMSRDEAEALVGSGGDRCVRMVRRADGATVVKDCPKTRAARDTAARLAGAGLAAGGALALAACKGEPEPGPTVPVMGIMCPPEQVETGGEATLGKPLPPAVENPGGEVILGEICPVEPPAPEVF